MPNSNFKLKGQYKVKVFDKYNNLKTDSDFLDNLITDSGLLFPYDVAFADSFRYLGLGSGNANPLVTSVTGLDKAISGFQYLGIYNGLTQFINEPDPNTFRDEGESLLGNYSEDYYYNPEGCGTNLKPDSVELFRTWRIPTGASNFMPRDYTGNSAIKELMVSPSAPIEQKMMTGGLSAYIPFISTGSHNLAFSRIVLNNPFEMSKDDYALVTYKLSIYPQTGTYNFTSTFTSTTFSTGFAGRPGCTGWTGLLSGRYSLTHPGIKLISDINGNSYHGVDAKNAKEFLSPYKIPTSIDGNLYFGISYSPLKIDCPLEPSVINSTYYYCYVSDDNTQFLANYSGGAIPATQTGRYFPYNTTGIKSSGLYKYIYDLPFDATNVVHDIRSSLTLGNFPNPDDLTDITTVSPTIKRSSTSSIITPIRTEPSQSINFAWPTNPTTSYVSALVIGYKDPNGNDPNVYPFFDMLFSTISGKLIPTLQTGYHPGLYGYFTPFGNSNSVKLYLDGINNLSLGFKLSWGRY